MDSTQTVEETDRTHADAVQSAAPVPAVVNDNETHVKCGHCGTGAKWKGDLEPEMLTNTFVRGVDEATGLPNCPRCGTVMDLVPILTPPENPIAAAAQMLDAERAGDAARPTYQPSIPGIHPPFDVRRALLTTESLERNIAQAEVALDAAKKVAAARKSDFDEAVEALRTHIQETHRMRVESEYQARKTADTTATEDPSAAGAVTKPCLYERENNRPCPICRKTEFPEAPSRDAVVHIAAGAAVAAIEGELDNETLIRSIEAVTSIHLQESEIAGWEADDAKAVTRWLEAFAGSSEPWTIAMPPVMGHFHEAAEASSEQQACRICGGVLQRFTNPSELDAEPWPVGRKVGTDCPGEPAAAEPARQNIHSHAEGRKKRTKKTH